MKSLLLLSAALVSFVAIQDRAEGKKEKTRLKAGDAVPEFTVKTLDGKDRTLASFRGEKKDKIVVVNFWAHTCPWSRAWDAELSKIAKDYSSKNVVVVSIDSNKSDHSDGKRTDNAESIAEYHKENKLNFDVFLDADHKVADAFGGETTPDIFVIGTDGKIAYTGQINDMKSADASAKFEKNYLRDALDASIGGKAPATTTTSPKGCSIKRSKKADKVKQ
ncbi:MAG: redoxin domain-containing protein [Planctomycetota bacterium]